ncbi:MAG: DUF5686 and carboxypeptidase regulatory-like domain-containing protein [Saprospiraceae bacterium]
MKINIFYKIVLLTIFTFPWHVYSQISGTITDVNGIPLPYATVYLEGTSIGTISNEEGKYTLELTRNDDYNIAYQYVGYKKALYNIRYAGLPIQKDIALLIDDNILNELTISADREDPAYEIIRKAIKKRSYFKNQVKKYEADLYVKGVVKITDAPKKILGENVGDMNGILDTSRQGIVYLSESKSKFYFQYPDQTKEVMVSSIKSGDNSLFTANQFSWASFDIYAEYLNFTRSIVSPIADNAMSHYNFRLDQVTIDQNGYTINKIKIIPKSNSSPLLNGYIYITDEYWNVYSTDISLYGNALKNTFLDTINIKQVYVPVSKPDTWRLFSQVISFKAGLFGFKMAGNFSYIFSDYLLNVDVASQFSTNETFKVEQNALKKDSLFWKKIRPIPLTEEEQKDYIKKDSLQKLWNTRSYMDSMDRVNNKFTLLKLLTGYSYEKSYKKTSISFPSPLSTLRFNAVEGFKINLNCIWEKKDSTYRKWTIHPVIEYGFADKILKPHISAEYKFDNYNQGIISFKAGRQNQQYDTRDPITERNNTWNSLWNKINRIRLFQNDFVTMGYRKELFNGFYVNLSTSYTSRKPVFVNTQYSLRRKDILYDENIPRQDLDSKVYQENSYLKNSISILICPAQKFSSYPYVKVRDVSNWPNITVDYESGIPITNNSSLFHKLKLKIKDNYVNARLIGYFSYNFEANTFIGSVPSYFADFVHPVGNQLQTPIGTDFSHFNLLPYYEFSTDKYYVQFNFRHHFNGFIFDKIPLINKTSLKMVAGCSGLYEHYKGQYIEPFVGIENFRIGPIQLFDVDYTWSFDRNGYRDQGITIRLTQLLNN